VSGAELRLEGLSAGYRGQAVLRGLDLDFAPGAYTCILGPSGSGKSTLLYSVAGLLAPRGGRILLGRRDITALDPGRRDVAFVFQSYALYPHLSVYENIAFPLRVRRLAPAVLDAKVRATAELLGLAALLARLPRELSGGERQRVALGRALVREPALLLLDEPLSNLDAQLRLRMRRELRALQRRFGVTTLHVTHDQGEALSLGDRVAVMRSGAVEQYAAPAELLARPATRFVAGFVGSPPANLGAGELAQAGGTWLLRAGESQAALPPMAWAAGWPQEGPVEFSVPLRACRWEAGGGPAEAAGGPRLRLPAEPTLAEELGGATLQGCDVQGRQWHVRADAAHAPGSAAAVSFAADGLRLYDPQTGLAVWE
jgi:ABC-type sugar transport system ATPase subunit